MACRFCCSIVVLLLALLVRTNGESSADETIVVLNVLPFPDSRSFAGWDRAYELIPASELAMEQINNRTDILPGYRLEIINVDSEACGIRIVSKGLANIYAELINQDLLFGGVVGLFCSTVTDSISPLSSPEFPFLDYVHVAGSTSVRHRDISEYPRLHHTISSSAIFNDAVLQMMTKFNWRKIGLVYNSGGVNFVSSAQDFNEKISTAPNFTLSTYFPLSPDNRPQLFAVLRSEQARTIFAVLTQPEAAALMCDAYQDNLSSGLAVILQERTVSDILESAANEDEITCSREQMIEAIEGVFLLNYRLEVDADVELVSGLSYSEYYTEYSQRLDAIEDRFDVVDLDRNNSYASVAYDEVWALALALNNSIEALDAMNLSLEDYREIEKRTQITEVIQNQLKFITFQGAAGLVKFTAQRETKSSVYISRVKNGSASIVAIYDPVDGLVRKLEEFEVPEDVFDTFFNVLPLWLQYSSYVIVAAIEAVTIFLFILHLIYWKRPEVKAASPYLSIVMFAGCFILAEATIFRTLSRVLTNLDDSTYKFICNVEVWSGSTGLNLIVATLLVRMLRVYHVFKSFGKTSKYWSDQYLFLGILALCSGAFVILTIWTAVDPIRKFREVVYIPNAVPPHYEVTLRCSSDHLTVWLGISFSYSGLLLNLVLFLAIKTRHIKKSNFKDTKKINAYLFAVTFAIAITLPLWFILEYGIQSRIGAHIAITTMFLSGVVLCLLLIFVPKVVPLLPCFPARWRRRSTRSYGVKSRQLSTAVMIIS